MMPAAVKGSETFGFRGKTQTLMLSSTTKLSIVFIYKNNNLQKSEKKEIILRVCLIFIYKPSDATSFFFLSFLIQLFLQNVN